MCECVCRCTCMYMCVLQCMLFVYAELRVREDSQKFIQALESGNSRWMRRTLQIVQSRCLQLLRVVQEDVVGRPEAYSHGQLSRIDNTAQSLREKCEENVCVSGFFHSLSLSLSNYMYLSFSLFQLCPGFATSALRQQTHSLPPKTHTLSTRKLWRKQHRR